MRSEDYSPSCPTKQEKYASRQVGSREVPGTTVKRWARLGALSRCSGGTTLSSGCSSSGTAKWWWRVKGSGFDVDAGLRRYPWVSRAMNAEAVYGTVLTAGLISAFSLYNPGLPVLIARTIGTVLVFWGAHVYAEIVGNRAMSWREAVREGLQRSAGLLWALIVPVACLTAAALLGLSMDAAVDISLWGGVVTLAILGWWASRQRNDPALVKVVTAAATAGMGLALIALKALVH